MWEIQAKENNGYMHSVRRGRVFGLPGFCRRDRDSFGGANAVRLMTAAKDCFEGNEGWPREIAVVRKDARK
jgi:hypothetical protein